MKAAWVPCRDCGGGYWQDYANGDSQWIPHAPECETQEGIKERAENVEGGETA